MKLILAIVSDDDSKACTKALNKARFHVTRLSSTGGFLSSGNTTLLIGCQEEQVEDAIKIIGEQSSRRVEAIPSTLSSEMNSVISFPMQVEIGGATVFVLDVEQFKKL